MLLLEIYFIKINFIKNASLLKIKMRITIAMDAFWLDVSSILCKS